MKTPSKDTNKNHPIKAIRRAAVSLTAWESADPAATIAGIEAALNGSASEIPMASWDCARGLSAKNQAGSALVASAGNPDAAVPIDTILTSLAKTEVADGILFAHNLHRFMAGDYVVQALWNLRDAWKARRNVLVMMAPAFNLPAELNQDVLIVSEAAPTEAEILDAAAGIADASGGVEEYEEQKIVDATLGYLARFAVEQSLALSVEKNGTKKAFNLARLWELKVQNLKATAGLEVMLPTESFDDLVGNEGYKDLIGKFLAGREQPRAVLHLDELEKMTAGSTGGDLSGVSQGLMEQFLYWTESRHVKGVLLCGVPGAGKTRAVTCTAGQAKVPHLRASMSTVKGGIVGESLPGDAEIYLCNSSGGNVMRLTMERAYELQPSGMFTPTYTNFGGFCRRKVTGFIRHERKEEYVRLVTQHGGRVVVTAGHSVFVKQKGTGVFGLAGAGNGGKAKMVAAEAGSVKVGDRIAIPLNWVRPSSPERMLKHGLMQMAVTEDAGTLLGLWLGDGSLNNQMVRISTNANDNETLTFLRRICGNDLTEYHKGDHPGHGIDCTLNSPAWAAHLFIMGAAGTGGGKHNLVGHRDSWTKRVPAWVFGAERKVQSAVLRGYFSADGCCSGHNIEAVSRSPKLARDICDLLKQFKILAHLKCKQVNNHPMWSIYISRAGDQRIFASKIGFLQAYKNAAVTATLKGKEFRKRRFKGRSSKAVYWDEVIAIEPVKSDEKYSYDISVEGTEKFVSGGVVVHNSEANMKKLLKCVDAVAQGRVLLIATCNSVESLSPELMARFKLATFVFDYPTDAEAAAIWKYYKKKYGLTDPTPANVKNWVGREIESCCERAWLFNCSLAEAAKSVVPICNSNAKKMDALRQSVSGRFLSASKMETYNFNPNAAEQKTPQAVRKMQ